MKIIGFLGQAVMIFICMGALALELDVIQLKYKLLLVVLCVFSGALIGVAGTTLIAIKYAHNEYVPTDLILLMAVCFCPIVLALSVLGIKGLMAPILYDISTDVNNPPVLLYARKSRTELDHRLLYPKDSAEIQLAAYPDIKSLQVPLPAREAFNLSIYTASLLGWSIKQENLSMGQIDLRDKTRFLGFRSDIAIRIAAVDANNSLIDMRSASMRVERDFGFNAQRLRAFLTGFDAELKNRQMH